MTEEAIRYHAFAADSLGEDSAAITDALMVQKVLVKLRGTERQRSMLTELRKALAGFPALRPFSTGF
jgi:5-methylcytosine-specific restriction enzyme B